MAEAHALALSRRALRGSLSNGWWKRWKPPERTQLLALCAVPIVIFEQTKGKRATGEKKKMEKVKDKGRTCFTSTPAPLGVVAAGRDRRNGTCFAIRAVALPRLRDIALAGENKRPRQTRPPSNELAGDQSHLREASVADAFLGVEFN